jgi:hypothetical protein
MAQAGKEAGAAQNKDKKEKRNSLIPVRISAENNNAEEKKTAGDEDFPKNDRRDETENKTKHKEGDNRQDSIDGERQKNPREEEER